MSFINITHKVWGMRSSNELMPKRMKTLKNFRELLLYLEAMASEFAEHKMG